MGVSESSSVTTVSLCGIVTDIPSQRSARMRATTAGTSPTGTVTASYRASMPRAEKAALWMAGESE